MTAVNIENGVSPPSITVQDLTYVFSDKSKGLEDVHFDLPSGSRTLLIGGIIKKASMTQSTELTNLSEWGWEDNTSSNSIRQTDGS